MIKLDNEYKIYELIFKALLETYNLHGPIRGHYLKSATKRIMGNIKCQLNNSKIRNIKRMRTQNGYKEIEINDQTIEDEKEIAT